MSTIRDYQESIRGIGEMIAEVKDDVEMLDQRGEYDPLMLFDLYNKLDDLAEAVEAVGLRLLEMACSERQEKN